MSEGVYNTASNNGAGDLTANDFALSIAGGSATVASTPSSISVNNRHALSFDGTDDVVVVPNSSSLAINGDISVSAWVYFDDFNTSTPTVLSKCTNGAFVGYAIEKNSSTNKLSFWIGDGTDYIEVTSGVLSAATWYHVVGTNDGTNSKIYIDGSLVASAAQGNPAGPTGDLKIGLHSHESQSFRYWDGYLDEIAVWNDVLTASDDLLVEPDDDFGFNGVIEVFQDARSFSPTQQKDI